MKKNWIIIFTLIAISIGCNRENDNKAGLIDGEFTLYASSEAGQTKTVLQQNGNVWWKPSDCINVFYGSASGKFTSNNREAASSAEFTGSLGSFVMDGVTEFVAAYPYSEATAISGNTLSINLPSEQVAAEGTFADELFISVAKSKDYNLHFYNVCGGVKFSLASDGVKKVVFKGNGGESLAGRLNVAFDDKGIPQVSSIDAGSETVSLVAPDGGTFKQGVWYYIVMAPQTLREGYTMEFYGDELLE